MLWHTSITPKWLMPLGEVAMTCVERCGHKADNTMNHDLGRWRS